MHFADVFPHNIQDGSTNEGILNSTGEEEPAGVLDQRPHDVGPSTLVYEVGTFQTTGHSRRTIHESCEKLKEEVKRFLSLRPAAYS